MATTHRHPGKYVSKSPKGKAYLRKKPLHKVHDVRAKRKGKKVKRTYKLRMTPKKKMEALQCSNIAFEIQ